MVNLAVDVAAVAEAGRVAKLWARLAPVLGLVLKRAGHGSAKAGALALVKLIVHKHTLVQLAGAATASVGVFVLWGLGVGLLTTGLAVVLASAVVEFGSGKKG